ncbi:carboxypeptidase regulatory-like domain-containing protein, partial [Natronomonas sp. CBA1123]|uniref:carboxypeptidase-like regulatory domain-containing protein n=1 Tax=Natronomonas sp. CBA1123 TaxID=2668070 RepID=UPI0012E9EE6C
MRNTLRVLIALSMVGWLLAGAVGGAAAQSESQVTLTVSVVDQDDTSIGDATITASWEGGERTATTASNGRAFVDVPEGETVELDAEHEEYVRNHPLVIDEATERDVTLRVSEKGNATVTVTDASDQALQDTRVEFRRDGRTAAEGWTDEDGTFSTDIIEQGEYSIAVVKPGYYRETSTEDVGVDTPVSFSLERGSVNFEVSVVDDHFEEPQELDDVRVSVKAENFEASVRSSGGTASLSVPVNTRYNVTVSKEGYVSSSRSLRVTEGAREIEMATQRVPTLTVEPQNTRVVVGETTRVRVLNAYGEPVEGATLQRNNETVGETDANGELVVTIDSAGEQELVATNGSVASDPVVVEGVDPDATETPGAATATPTATEGSGAGLRCRRRR